MAAQFNAGGLAQVLMNTYHENNAIRGAAEQTLGQFEAQPGIHGLILEVLSTPEGQLPFHVKQAASLRLKNLWSRYGTIREGEANKISQADRHLVRDRILEAVIRQTHPLLRVQLLQVIYHAFPTDAPQEWASFVPAVMANLQQGMSQSPPDMMRIYGSVCALRMIFKRYQFKARESRAPIEAIVEQTFPLLLQILQAMASLGPQQATEETREICRILLKIFFLATTLALPPVLLADFNRVVPWLDVMLHLMDQPIPGLDVIMAQSPGINQIDAEEKLRVTPGWRCKKWIIQTLQRLYSRWGRPKMVGEDKKQSKEERAARKAWATQFENNYTARVLAVIMNILKVKTQGGYVTDRIIHQCLTYVATSVDSAVLYKLLKPHLPFLIQEVILQQLAMKPADLLLWKEDPQEYIRQSLDLMAEFMDPRMAAMNLLIELIQNRTRDTLQLTLTTIQQVFEAYAAVPDPAQRNWIQKDAAMRMFGGIKRLLLSDKRLKQGIEAILTQHILPEFTNPTHGSMRARACWVVRKYWKLKWSNEAAHAEAVRLCVERLSDPELPVKMDAWNAVSYIIEQEKVLTFLKPSLPLIIDVFHTLFEEIGNDTVVSVLQQLVEKFGEEVVPFAIQLVNKLAHLYIDLQQSLLASGDIDDYDEAEAEDEKAMTAASCVRTVVAVLYAVQSKPALYSQLLAPCCAILDCSINDRSVECYEDILDMISVLIYQPEDGPIPDCMWKYLPQVTGSFFTYAEDFLECMLPVFDTFLVKGGAQLVTPQGQPMLQSLFNIAKKILEDQNRLIDSAHACVLIESILANLRGQVDILIGPIVELSGTRLITIITMEEEREAARKKREAARLAAKKKKGNSIIKKGKGGKVFASKGAEMTMEEEEEDEESQELAALKMALLDNIGIACHYNPVLFSQVITAAPPAFSQKLFNIWLSYVRAMKNDFDVAKNAVLGLSSLLIIPLASVPEVWRAGMPHVLGVLLEALTEMSKLLAETDAAGEKEEDSDAEEDETEFRDIDENQDVITVGDHGDIDDEVDVDEAAEAGDENAPEMFLDEVEEAMLRSGEITKFQSPLDDIDPFVFFAQAVQTLAQQESAFYQQWMQAIGQPGQAVLQQHLAQATKHAKEIEEEKAAAAAKSASQK